jgi:5-methylcytosine-specific restriction endonuclease McrA
VSIALGKNSVTANEYNKKGKYHNTILVKKFGSWFKALEKAGLNKTRNLNITDEEFFQDIENTWMKLGRQPRYKEMQAPLSKYSSATYAYRFGTFLKALEKFVEYINNEKNLSSEESIKKLDVKPTTKHTTSRNINWRLRFIVMRQDNFKCKNCGRSPATDPSIVLHVDHIKAWANGGETILENLQAICSKCNIGKSDL